MTYNHRLDSIGSVGFVVDGWTGIQAPIMVSLTILVSLVSTMFILIRFSIREMKSEIFVKFLLLQLLLGCISVNILVQASINNYLSEKLKQTKAEIAKLYFQEETPGK